MRRAGGEGVGGRDYNRHGGRGEGLGYEWGSDHGVNWVLPTLKACTVIADHGRCDQRQTGGLYA